MSFCDTDIPIRCESCLEIPVNSCDILTVAANLTPDTVFELFVLDQFNNHYHKPITTDENGSFEIDYSAFPTGLFNSNGGEYEVFVSASASPITFVPMTISAVIYNCILLAFTVCCPEDLGSLSDEGGNLVADEQGNIMPEPKI